MSTVTAQVDDSSIPAEQQPVFPDADDYEGTTYHILEYRPSFPGGEDSMYHFIREHLIYPQEAKVNKVSGVVYVSFIIEIDGNLTDVEVKNGIGYGCDEEAIRLVRLMPEWIPGMQKGKPVRVRYKFPIHFYYH